MKKILKGLIAFSIGNAMLLLSYILVYAIDGNPRFTQEIEKLTEFEYLLGQVVLSGMTCVVIYIAILIFQDFESKKNKVEWKDLAKFIGSCFALFVVFIAILLIDRRGIQNEYVESVFIGIIAIGCIVASIVYIIYNFVQRYKINKALKERQS